MGTPVPLVHDNYPIRAYTLHLAPFGKEAVVRSAIAIGQLALPLWTRSAKGNSIPGRAIDAAREWVLRPSAENQRNADRCVEAAWGSADGVERPAYSVAWISGNVAQAAAADSAGTAAGAAFSAADRASRDCGLEGFAEAIRRALVPWALADFDPLSGPPGGRKV